jgi:hypothetical protein
LHRRPAVVWCSRPVGDQVPFDAYIRHDAQSSIVGNDGIKHFLVQEYIKFTCPKGCKLPKHDIFRNATAIIKLSASGSLKKDLNGLLK